MFVRVRGAKEGPAWLQMIGQLSSLLLMLLSSLVLLSSASSQAKIDPTLICPSLFLSLHLSLSLLTHSAAPSFQQLLNFPLSPFLIPGCP